MQGLEKSNTQKKVLITGGSGLLAVNWALSVRNDYEVTLLLHHKKITISGVDAVAYSISSLDNCLSVLDKYQPDIVIHTAGLTNVEECESNPYLAQEVNVDLAKNMAIACSNQCIKLVHISTDHLFDGSSKNINEDDIPNPLNIYAKTKLKGEKNVLDNNKDALIIRTNFYTFGPSYRESFSDFIISNLEDKKPISLFSDVNFNPIIVSELVAIIYKLVDKNCFGIYNVVSNELNLSNFQSHMEFHP